ncbi:hypothetical protein PIB30_046294 [Stylosanthes scabra]|uniref:SCP domain-containing protein n=1 Tax=Stylosanthes scabra TaxID=79078 RepID=A0ABU6QH66_9FABA|nr:hypothetical protein [Stylosanthes scabra]
MNTYLKFYNYTRMENSLKIWTMIISFVNVVPLLLIAQNSPNDYLKAHNDARKEVGVKPLEWDPQLASHAGEFVEKHIADCITGLIDVAFPGTYGQNAAYNSVSETGTEAVAAWVQQKYNYDYKSNSCVDGTTSCHCYTQIVRDTVTLLGCARVECRNYGGTLTTCLYYPEDAVLNQQRPYKLH